MLWNAGDARNHWHCATRSTSLRVNSAHDPPNERLAAADDFAQLRERGLLGFCIVVVTPGNDFEHLSSQMSLPFRTASRRPKALSFSWSTIPGSGGVQYPNNSKKLKRPSVAFLKHRSESARATSLTVRSFSACLRVASFHWREGRCPAGDS